MSVTSYSRYLLLFWVLVWGLDIAKDIVGHVAQGLDLRLTRLMIDSTTWWGAWAFFSVGAAWMAAKLSRQRWFVQVSYHLAASVLVGLLHLSVATVVFRAIGGDLNAAAFRGQLSSLFTSFELYNMFIYWGVVSAFLALNYYRRFRDRELAAARLEGRAAELETHMVEARLSALRRQLHPHFLFNTLNSISGFVRRGDRDAAVEMLARIGDFLRTTLEQEGVEEVSLETEVDYVRQYLGVQRVRFHDRLSIDIDVAPPARSALVPTLILQPLAENAVRHGVEVAQGPVAIQLAASVADDRLVVTVRDTGGGFDNDGRPADGIGLSNTRERLRMLYGSRASLDLRAENGVGAVATLTVPLHYAMRDPLVRD